MDGETTETSGELVVEQTPALVEEGAMKPRKVEGPAVASVVRYVCSVLINLFKNILNID